MKEKWTKVEKARRLPQKQEVLKAEIDKETSRESKEPRTSASGGNHRNLSREVNRSTMRRKSSRVC